MNSDSLQHENGASTFDSIFHVKLVWAIVMASYSDVFTERCGYNLQYLEAWRPLLFVKEIE
jgi:hypothetical protein